MRLDSSVCGARRDANAAVGFNWRDRNLEAEARRRMREVRALDAQGLALHLIVTGGRAFNDRCFVAQVLDRVHRKRGIASLCYCDNVRATTFADRWAQSRFIPVRWIERREILKPRVHGVIAFDGPHLFIERARAAGLIVWHVAPQTFIPATDHSAVASADARHVAG